MAGKRPSMESAETRANILLRAGNIRAYDVRAKRKVHMKSDPAPQIVSRLNKRNGKRILFIKGIAKETGNEVWRLVGQM